MFQSLSNKFDQAIQTLKGEQQFTKKNTQPVLKDIRSALLDADVALPVVDSLLDQIQRDTLGKTITQTIKAQDAMVQVVHNAIINHLKHDEKHLIQLKGKRPFVFLMAGLQGTGKTTSAVKLALWLKKYHQLNILLASTDVYRPAAIDQLETLAKQAHISFFPSSTEEKPLDIAQKAMKEAQRQAMDVVILDTAGRLHLDTEMMDEIKSLNQAMQPQETFFVVDSMTGQDAANTAKAFHDALPLTGVILSKTDGDQRGGAALSVRAITGKPIKFIGTGETLQDFDTFEPERIASQILGMGDVLALVRDAEEKIDKKKASKVAQRVHKGIFSLEDFQNQLQQMKNMGGLNKVMDKMPGMGKIKSAMNEPLDETIFNRFVTLINSMTAQEKQFPDLLKKQKSRKIRVIKGSGVSDEDFMLLFKHYDKTKKMMGMFKGNKMKKLMKRLGKNNPNSMPSDLDDLL
jgi:signal recognition particle subunit SRP54